MIRDSDEEHDAAAVLASCAVSPTPIRPAIDIFNGGEKADQKRSDGALKLFAAVMRAIIRTRAPQASEVAVDSGGRAGRSSRSSRSIERNYAWVLS